MLEIPKLSQFSLPPLRSKAKEKGLDPLELEGLIGEVCQSAKNSNYSQGLQRRCHNANSVIIFLKLVYV